MVKFFTTHHQGISQMEFYTCFFRWAVSVSALFWNWYVNQTDYNG